MESAGNNCSAQPTTLFLLITLIVTVVATAMLCAAIMTEHWEYVTWDKEKLKTIEKDVKNSSFRNDYELEWLLDGQVIRVVLDAKYMKKKNSVKEIFEDDQKNQNIPALFLVPIQGGIWIFCINVTVEQHRNLYNYGFPKMLCTNYLRPDTTKKASLKADWQHRMQNLSISCALVCLIILGSSALIGAFGVTKHQISAVLVTGVMYLLAATFATFSLAIIHFKRSQSKMDCFNDSTTHELEAEGVVVSETALLKSYKLKKVNKYFEARIFSTGWSLHLGWGGAGMCILVSIFWILLAKIMRYNPLNTLLTVI